VRDQIQNRLAELKKEFEKGQVELQNMERQQAYLRETLFRISGAAQVLEELLAEGERGMVHETSAHQTHSRPPPAERAGATVGGSEFSRLAVDDRSVGQQMEGLTAVA
jgi:predicted nuclease with TOPRIM domain